jgi:hypothetical protein
MINHIRLDPKDVDLTQLRYIGDAPDTQEHFLMRLFGDGEVCDPVNADWYVALLDPDDGSRNELFISFDTEGWRYCYYAADLKPILLIEQHMARVKKAQKRRINKAA